MSLKDAADLATSLTLVVATITFVLAAFEHKQREQEKLKLEKQKSIQNWQRVVVYKIIEAGATTFSQIRSLYLDEAQMLSSFDLPKTEIQEDALRLALMVLTSDRLISKTDDGGYSLNAVSSQENDWRQFAMLEMERRRNSGLIIASLQQLLENESGRYTIDRLYTVLKGNELGLSFEEFNLLVRNYVLASRGSIVFSTPSEKIWLRSKLPPTQNQQPHPSDHSQHASLIKES